MGVMSGSKAADAAGPNKGGNVGGGGGNKAGGGGNYKTNFGPRNQSRNPNISGSKAYDNYDIGGAFSRQSMNRQRDGGSAAGNGALQKTTNVSFNAAIIAKPAAFVVGIPYIHEVITYADLLRTGLAEFHEQNLNPGAWSMNNPGGVTGSLSPPSLTLTTETTKEVNTNLAAKSDFGVGRPLKDPMGITQRISNASPAPFNSQVKSNLPAGVTSEPGLHSINPLPASFKEAQYVNTSAKKNFQEIAHLSGYAPKSNIRPLHENLNFPQHKRPQFESPDNLTNQYGDRLSGRVSVRETYAPKFSLDSIGTRQDILGPRVRDNILDPTIGPVTSVPNKTFKVAGSGSWIFTGPVIFRLEGMDEANDNFSTSKSNVTYIGGPLPTLSPAGTIRYLGSRGMWGSKTKVPGAANDN